MPRKHEPRRVSSTGLRTVAFFGLALAIIGGAFYFSRPKEMAFIEIGPEAASRAAASGAPHAMAGASMAPSGAKADITMRVDMGGFTPSELRVAAGQPTRLLIVNPDDSHHTDGGGWHQFAVPGLGLDIRIPPLTNMVITVPAAQPGEYQFWCDTCCGGKENPTMQGKLRVTA